jgi:hypothetical protein
MEAILQEDCAIELIPIRVIMETLTSLIVGSLINSSRNTSGNYLTIGILANSMLPFFNSLT